MSLLRWIVFGWLAAILAWLAGGSVSYPKRESDSDKLARLLSLEKPNRRQKAQIERLLGESDVIVLE